MQQEVLVPLFIDSFSLTSFCIKLIRSTIFLRGRTCKMYNFYSEFECVEDRRRAQVNKHLFPGTITNLTELANLRG